MSAKLQLPERGNLSEQEYVQKKLIPMASEMERMFQKLFSSDQEDEYSDMTCIDPCKKFTAIDTKVLKKPLSKKIEVPYEYPLINQDKSLKALFMCAVWSKYGGTSAFRLVNSSTGDEIEGSLIQSNSNVVGLHQRYLKVGHGPNEIKFGTYEYHVEAKIIGNQKCVPICRSFNISLTYV